MHDLPGSLRLTSTFPFVGRSARAGRRCARSCRGPTARAAASCCSAASPARARAASCASSPPRRPATARSSSTAPATRWCARPTGRSSRRSTSSRGSTEPAELRAALGTAGGELTRLLPDLPARVGDLPAAGRGRPGHRAPPPAHGRRRPARRRQPAPAGAARARGRPLGRRADAAAPAPPRAGGRGRAAAAARHLPRHRGRRARRRSSETLADLRRSEDVVRLRLAGLSGDEVAEFVRRAAGGESAPGCPSSRRRSASSPRATRSWSASCGARSSRPSVVEVADGAIRLDAAADRARHARERARGRQPAARAPGARRPPTCSSSRPPRARSSSSTIVRARRRLDGARAARGASTRRSAAG